MNRLKINNEDLVGKITGLETLGILAVENFIDLLINYYIYQDDQISTMSREEILILCVETLCDLIRQGAIHSKWLLAELIIKQSRYIYHDKILTKFLIELSAFENQPDACHYMADKYLDFGDKDIADFWLAKAQIGSWKQKVGEKLNLHLMRKENSQEGFTYIYFKE